MLSCTSQSLRYKSKGFNASSCSPAPCCVEVIQLPMSSYELLATEVCAAVSHTGSKDNGGARTSAGRHEV